MENIKEQLEEVIKKNLPEKKEVPRIDGKWLTLDDRNDGFNQALSQINTSLIADEVLKVVVEKIEGLEHEWDNPIKDNEASEQYILGNKVGWKLHKKFVLQLLSTLSPNKENKNNGI